MIQLLPDSPPVQYRLVRANREPEYRYCPERVIVEDIEVLHRNYGSRNVLRQYYTKCSLFAVRCLYGYMRQEHSETLEFGNTLHLSCSMHHNSVPNQIASILIKWHIC